MIALALEFSSALRSVAVCNTSLGDATTPGTATDEHRQTTKPFVLVEQALRAAHLERDAIERIVVGLGPGSYTGIRSSIAIAQGWQLARGVKLLGIGSVEALARQAQQLGWSGHGHFAIDAQRGEFYVTACELSDRNVPALQPLRIASRDEVEQLARSGDWLAGPELEQHFAGAKNLYPNASAIGQLAATRTDFILGEKLEPIYLRETQFVKTTAQR